MARGVHHADAAVAGPGELRSEWVTVLRAGGAGFGPGRVRRRRPPRRDLAAARGRRRARAGGSRPSWAGPCWRRASSGSCTRWSWPAADGRDPAVLLEAWADLVGQSARARIRAPYQVGWCSWYHYFHDVTEADLRANLARAQDWPFDVFQLDDGFQSAIGDWLRTNDRFDADGRRAGRRHRGPGPGPGSVDRPVHRRPRLGRGAGPSRLAGPHRRRPSAARHVQPAVGWRPGRVHVGARHHPPRRGRAPRVDRPRPGRRRLPLPQVRLHLRAQLPGRLARRVGHPGPAGAGRVRRAAPRCRRRHVHPRVRGAAVQRGGRGRRQSHRLRTWLRPGSGPTTARVWPATRRRCRPPAMPCTPRWPARSCTAGCGSTTRTA